MDAGPEPLGLVPRLCPLPLDLVFIISSTQEHDPAYPRESRFPFVARVPCAVRSSPALLCFVTRVAALAVQAQAPSLFSKSPAFTFRLLGFLLGALGFLLKTEEPSQRLRFPATSTTTSLLPVRIELTPLCWSGMLGPLLGSSVCSGPLRRLAVGYSVSSKARPWSLLAHEPK